MRGFAALRGKLDSAAVRAPSSPVGRLGAVNARRYGDEPMSYGEADALHPADRASQVDGAMAAMYGREGMKSVQARAAADAGRFNFGPPPWEAARQMVQAQGAGLPEDLLEEFVSRGVPGSAKALRGCRAAKRDREQVYWDKQRQKMQANSTESRRREEQRAKAREKQRRKQGKRMTKAQGREHNEACRRRALRKMEKERRRMEREPGYTPSMRLRVYDRDGWKCVACGFDSDPLKLTLDHKTPRSQGGRSTMGNLQTMCEPCNHAKADRV